MKNFTLPVILLGLLLLAIPAVAEFYNLSPNMSLPIPQVGVETGPNYATDINNSLTILDGHNHTLGYGVPIPSNGINLNADLPFNGQNATLLRSCRYSPQSAFSLTADNDSTYVNGVDLYYRDGNGNNVRLTQSGAVAGTPGSIGSLVAPASATYVAGTGAFVFQSAASAAGDVDGRNMILRNASANSNGLTLSPPSAMGSNLTETLPSLPVATSFMQIDTGGNMAGSVAVSAGLTGSNLASNVNLSGKAVQENGKNVVVSNTNATNSLAIVRGGYKSGVPSGTSCGASAIGEGYTCTRTGTGNFTISFSTAFGDDQSCTCSGFLGGLCTLSSPTTSGFLIAMYNLSGSLFDQTFQFTCIGQRQ